ncbi:MAG: hypothetical protein L6R38_008661 [Xanthoria sp. 2 TBL-2021]|nr:MAG: hypothetical protein L6R38_008661 [Xanthoria sp. 2 TBL-2021]
MALHPAVGELHPASDQLLLSTLSASASTFLQPTPALHTAALLLAKRYLDPLALSATEAQADRLKLSRQKQRRHHAQPNRFHPPFHIRQLHLEGFPTQQVWAQARRVLDASTHEIEATLHDIQPSQHDHDEQPRRKRVRFDSGASEEGDSVHNTLVGEPAGDDTADEIGLENTSEGASEASLGPVEEASDEYDEVDSQDDDIKMDSEPLSEIDEPFQDEFVPDKHGLNDGFFSIDEFNRQSDFMENQDARGEPDNDASDEEEIDWGAEPAPLPEGDDHALEGEDDDDDGPTFGNADLNAADTDSNASEGSLPMEGMGASSNTNDIMYADFFAPPPSKAGKSTRTRALPKTQPASISGLVQEDDVNRTIAAVRRDIFEDHLSAGEDSETNSVIDPGDPRSRRSNHERRQAKIAEEIRKLEAANVAKRDWTLSGEARAADRPINSLLEEDLEFERAGKPVPVITNEVSEDIEALIKRRIINREFDEVIRRRPGDLATGAAAARRGRFELDDTKPQQSLAEVYEAEHLKRTDPEGYVDKRDEKLKKEHAAIESLWAEVSAKLDSLSSWHYKPRPPQANITVVADVPKVSMEDARPSAAEGMGPETSMLAPQEVYKPGEERSREDKQKEVVLRSGVPVARQEMSREEKLRRRRREKERIKKRGGTVMKPTAAATAGVKKAAERKGVVGDLKRGGVRVIGKKGELVDVEGKAVQGSKGAIKGGGSFKL